MIENHFHKNLNHKIGFEDMKGWFELAEERKKMRDIRDKVRNERMFDGGDRAAESPRNRRDREGSKGDRSAEEVSLRSLNKQLTGEIKRNIPRRSDLIKQNSKVGQNRSLRGHTSWSFKFNSKSKSSRQYIRPRNELARSWINNQHDYDRVGPSKPTFKEYVCSDQGSTKGCTRIFESQEEYVEHIKQRNINRSCLFVTPSSSKISFEGKTRGVVEEIILDDSLE